MNRKGILLISVLAFGLVLSLALIPKKPQVTAKDTVGIEDAAQQEVPAAPGIEETESAVAAAADAPAGMDEATVDRLIARGFIPREYRELWLDPDAEKIIQERFDVIPRVELPKGEVCAPIEFDGGHVCWNRYGHHPYLAYDLDALRHRAESDAVAAEALSLRLPHENLHERLHYALLASKLSGKSGPIMRFAYSFTPDKNSPDYADQLLDRYAIALTAEAMGFPYRLSRELENHIARDLNLSREQLDDAMNGRRVTLLQEMGGGS